MFFDFFDHRRALQTNFVSLTPAVVLSNPFRKSSFKVKNISATQLETFKRPQQKQAVRPTWLSHLREFHATTMGTPWTSLLDYNEY